MRSYEMEISCETFASIKLAEQGCLPVVRNLGEIIYVAFRECSRHRDLIADPHVRARALRSVNSEATARQVWVRGFGFGGGKRRLHRQSARDTLPEGSLPAIVLIVGIGCRIFLF